MRAVLTMLLMLFFLGAAGQAKPDTLDVNTLIRKWTGKQESGSKPPSGISLLPAVGYNPSLGFILGANITAGKYLGDHRTTSLSTATATAYFTTKGVINLQLRHNIFTKNNHAV